MMNSSDDSLSAPKKGKRPEQNLNEKKGDLGDGQKISEVRDAVESDFNVRTPGEKFLLIKQMDTYSLST